MRSLRQLGVMSIPPAALVEPEETHGYPRPQLRRTDWTSLNGIWDLALDEQGNWACADEPVFDRTIVVPFAPETKRSGVSETGLFRSVWYRRTIELDEIVGGTRTLLHFGAVDYFAAVFVDGQKVGSHEGGYTPFEIDITDAIAGKKIIVLCVHAQDDPRDLSKPRGKQDWQLEPHSIWYPRTTGIWQTVWLERVPKTRIRHLRWTSNLERWEIGLEALICSESEERLRLHVKLRARDVLLADDTYLVIGGEVQRRIALSDPGIDDFRNVLLWSPDTPTLLEAEVTLIDAKNEVIDSVASYTALRQIALQGDKFLLNGRPLQLRLVLDQGYWPDTGQTPPDDGAIRRDIVLTKAMGFNGVRKHQKIEDPRFLYWADRLGLLVWEEMPSAYRFTRRSIERVAAQWMEVLARDASHPCIVAWVPFNESWGVPNLPDSAPERHYVRAIYHLTKSLDPTRPVIGNDGWESTATDIIGIHDYDPKPERIAERYVAKDLVSRFLENERPGGRQLVLDGQPAPTAPVVLSEFGGLALATSDGRTWGYFECATPEELATRYCALLAVVHKVGLFAGFCYTQLTDTYQEANGLLTSDREPKIPLDVIYRATTGGLSPKTSAVHANESSSEAPGPILGREGAPQ